MAAFVSLFISYVVVWREDPRFFYMPLTTRRSMQDLCSVLLLGFCWHALFVACGLYRSRKAGPQHSEVMPVLLASLFSSLPTLLCWAITRDYRRSDFFHAISICLLASCLFPLWLVVVRSILQFLNRHLWARTPDRD